MELIFLGTASNNPSPARAVSCTAIRFGIYLHLIFVYN